MRIPIAGATKVEHLEDALNATMLKLTQKDITSLEEVYVPHAKVGYLLKARKFSGFYEFPVVVIACANHSH